MIVVIIIIILQQQQLLKQLQTIIGRFRITDGVRKIKHGRSQNGDSI
jgi:hypothetical protein